MEGRRDTETASSSEMAFASHFLNVAGALFVLVGAGLFLRSSLAGATTGLAQIVAGTLGGLLLVALGEACYRRSLRPLDEGLVAAGLCALLMTASASYFYFHLVDRATMATSVAGLVALSGFYVFRCDSRLIGGFLLATLYLGPLLLEFPLDRIGPLTAYLTAVQAGIVVMAWLKRWEWFLLVSFLATCALFFYCVGTGRPAEALQFLTVAYALFLVSNNVLLFRGDAGEYTLALSFVNPLVYGTISFSLVSRQDQSNYLATGLYLALAIVHLALYCAARLRRVDDVAVGNLVLGLLFGTAAISFFTYFSTSTECFALVTALWLVQALLLLETSYTANDAPRFALIMRRFSYLAIFLTMVQAAVVLPSIAEHPIRVAINSGVIGAWLWYLRLMLARLPAARDEEIAAMRAVALAAIVLGFATCADGCPPTIYLPALCAISLAALVAAVRFPQVLGYLREAAAATGVVASVGLLVLDLDAGLAGFAACIVGALLAAVASAVLRMHVPDAMIERIATTMTTAALLMKGTLYLSTGAASTLAWSLAAFVLMRSALRRGVDADLQPARLLYLMVLIKAITFDGNFIYQGGGMMLAPFGCLTAAQLAAITLLVMSLFAAAAQAAHFVDIRNALLTEALLVATFQSAFVLYDLYGVLDWFQVILSAFWAASAFLYVLNGIYRRLKVFRLFGLVLLASAAAKICLVDIWVLNAYSQTTTMLIMGAMLMAVSFLYQSHRARLTTINAPCGSPTPSRS